MDTKLFILKDYKENGHILDKDSMMINEAATIIRKGGLVAFPTETVYGLGGNALVKESALKIYKAKGRPQDNPLIVHIGDISALRKIVREVSPEALVLIDRFWPGPMTLIFKKSVIIPYETTGGLETVAVRFPSNPVAQKLITLAKVPIAAPSANLSGHPSATSFRHCVEDLMGKVDAILDGGDSQIGLESTIIDLTEGSPRLLRPGAITLEMLEETLNRKLELDAALMGPLSKETIPKAPGMKYRHYAPQATMVILRSKEDRVDKKLTGEVIRLIDTSKSKYQKLALLCSDECLKALGISDDDVKKGSKVLSDTRLILKAMGSRDDPESIAHDIFEDLRDCDRLGVDFIIAEGYKENGLFGAVMNRLKKAASWQIIDV